MKKLTSQEIRNMWLKFFEKKGHYIVPSGSLIPVDDDSLLWINAGVATLKKYFDGSEQPPKARMTNSQKSIRTGDIENIGITARHHTFFEMVGNFSIGDYFKNEAIELAFEILTSPNYFAIPIDKLWITVFEEDEDAIKRWVEVGFPREKIFKMGRDTNFWDMGKGPSGPSTEIFFDRGEKYDSRTAEELIIPDLENDRFIEVWNIVFSQFNNDGQGNYTELPQKNIDTGAGLERLASVFQDTPTNFETDLFLPIINKISEFSGKEYVYDYIPGKLSEEQESIQRAMKQIADFARTSTFAIGDGAIPSNSGRGYVIRRLIRRAVAGGVKLGIKEPFVYKLAPVIADIMDSFYPEVRKNIEIIQDKIQAEEVQFSNTLRKSSELLAKLIKQTEAETLPANEAFELYETHGLPFEFISEMAGEAGKKVIKEDFDKLMEAFQAQSRANMKQTDGMSEQNQLFRGIQASEFIGYERLEATVKVIDVDGNNLALDRTPFYATSGGQEFDQGTIEGVQVTNVYKNGDNVFVHELAETPTFKVGEEVKMKVDGLRRTKLMRNHSSVHLSFKALENALNFQVPQVGSKVEEDFFRFDFTYHKEIPVDILTKVEKQVNEWISQGVNCDIKTMKLRDAKELGATFLEGTKYGKEVRVVNFEGITIDLCGGTHVSNTADIQDFKLIKIEKKGSGTFRITGASGANRVAQIQEELATKAVELVKTEISNMKAIMDSSELEIIKKTSMERLAHEPAQVVLKKAKAKVEDLNTKLKEELKDKFESFSNLSVIEFLGVNKKALGTEIKILTSKLIEEVVFVTNEIDETKNVAFVIGRDADQNRIANMIREVASTIENVRGGGARQLYQFGGPVNEVNELIEAVKGKLNG